MPKHLTFLLLLLTVILNAQTVTVEGTVTDSLQNPLQNANLLAVPNADDEDIRFAITNTKGQYQLKLSSNQSYKITVSYLGFKAQNLNLNTTSTNLTQHVVLQENPDQLDEVIINYTPPVTIKKDTTIYDVSKFTTGEERKLRESLKKLPGFEVDKAGNVKVNGKKVTKVLVEDKTFFTGNSKLAVNNIPADAVDKVEVLDNYNEVAMLKGLQDSDDMALNIKLKEDKKNFVFGDVEVGVGIKNRYVAHPNIFYYTPNTSFNAIGDINNTGVKSFTFQDYLEFEGGFGKLLSDAGSYFDLYSNDFAQFLNNQNYTSNTNQFGAVHLRQSLNTLTDISGYIITSNAKTTTQNQSLNSYQNISNPFTETRNNANTLNNFFTIAKLTLDYEPSIEEDLSLNSVVKVTNNNSLGIINTSNLNQNNTISTQSTTHAFNIKQNINYSRKLSKNHTGTLEATYSFNNDKPITEWLTNQQILQGLLPLEAADRYNILQTKTSKSHSFNSVLKEYWVLNNFNHIYTSFGVNAAFNSFVSTDVQRLENGGINNFNSAGFGNNFNHNFINTFLGVEYKFLNGITTFKPALYYHNYLWRTQQFNTANTFNKNLLLPRLDIDIEFNNSKKLNFNYKLNARFPGVSQLANNFMLSGFNSVYKGNSTLENKLYHSAYVSYYRFSLFKQLSLNASVNYNKRLTTIKNTTALNGIESFNTPILLDLPENSWRLNGRITKKINKIKYKFSSRFSYNDFYQVLNTNTNLNISKSVSSTLGLETTFKNHPNVELSYTKDFSNYKAQNVNNPFENDRIEVNIAYDFFKDFIVKVDYTFDRYNNKNEAIINTFDTANASLFYQKEDSPWGFEVNATNIFDVRFKQQNSFNAFIISDSRTFILPRIVMFKLSYKL